MNAGLLVLRVGICGVLAAHGTQKLFGWFGGHGLLGTSQAFEQMGFRPGKLNALFAVLGEAGGGTLIALGLATPVAASAATATMISAAAVHAPAGFFATQGGLEYPAVLGLSSAALALTGPGNWSIDALTGYRLARPWMAAASLAASIGASARILRHRQHVLAEAARAEAEQAERRPFDSAPAG